MASLDHAGSTVPSAPTNGCYTTKTAPAPAGAAFNRGLIYNQAGELVASTTRGIDAGGTEHQIGIWDIRLSVTPNGWHQWRLAIEIPLEE